MFVSMFEPMCSYPSFSNVPHPHVNAVLRLHGNKLGPFRVGSIRNLDHTFAHLLLPIDPREFILSQIDVGNGTVRCQVGIIHSRD